MSDNGFVPLSDPHLSEAIAHASRQADLASPVELTAVLVDDWLIFARDREGNAFYTATEMWEEWLDLAPEAEYERGAVQKYMLPVAWHKGYFRERSWWTPVEADCVDDIPKTTIDGVPPYWEKAPDFPTPAPRVETEATSQSLTSPEDQRLAEQRLLDAIFGRSASSPSPATPHTDTIQQKPRGMQL